MLFFEIEHFTNKRSPLQTEGRRDCSPSDLKGVSGFLCLGRLFQGQPNEAALCI